MGKGERGTPQLGKGALQGALEAPPSPQALPRQLEPEADSRLFSRAEVTVPTAFAALLLRLLPPSKRLGLNRTILVRIAELYMVWPVSLPATPDRWQWGLGAGDRCISLLVCLSLCRCRKECESVTYL